MACGIDDDRSEVVHRIRTEEEILAMARRYADHYGVTVDQLIECALASFINFGSIPVPIQYCKTHRCLLEANSSGTVTDACPVEQGSAFPFYPEQILP